MDLVVSKNRKSQSPVAFEACVVVASGVIVPVVDECSVPVDVKAYMPVVDASVVVEACGPVVVASGVIDVSVPLVDECSVPVVVKAYMPVVEASVGFEAGTIVIHAPVVNAISVPVAISVAVSDVISVASDFRVKFSTSNNIDVLSKSAVSQRVNTVTIPLAVDALVVVCNICFFYRFTDML